MMQHSLEPALSVLDGQLYINPDFICPIIISNRSRCHIFCTENDLRYCFDSGTQFIKINIYFLLDFFLRSYQLTFGFEIFTFRAVSCKECFHYFYSLWQIFKTRLGKHFQKTLICPGRIVNKLWIVFEIVFKKSFFLFNVV